MTRTYEIMFIVRPDVEEADLDKLIEGFSKNVTDGGGEVRSVEKMGRRRLAYTVRKFNDGFYVLLTVVAAGSLVGEIERRLRVSEPVIKFITVRIDEEEKRLAKIKEHRETHVKRSAQPVAQPAAQPAPVSINAAAVPQANEPAAPETAEPPATQSDATPPATQADAAEPAPSALQSADAPALMDEDAIVTA